MQHNILSQRNDAVIYGLSISVLILSLYVYWFKIANRSIVFLYDHNMGPYISSTAPFSFVTSSRYWMAGLVASGLVMVLYVCVNTIMSVTFKAYVPPEWHSVWIMPAILSVIFIPLVTMTASNGPALTPSLAIKLTISTIVGLALALQPGSLLTRSPAVLILYAFDGLALSLILIGATGIEHIQSWIERGVKHYILLTFAAVLAGLMLLFLLTGIRYFFKHLKAPPVGMFISGLSVAYPGMSILHHTMFSDGYYYISDSDNFFARNIPLQLAIWVGVFIICLGFSRLRFLIEDRHKTGYSTQSN